MQQLEASSLSGGGKVGRGRVEMDMHHPAVQCFHRLLPKQENPAV